MVHQAAPAPLLQPLLAPMQPYLPPPPSYLPPLENTRDLAGGVVSQGKGYQQITSWQVSQDNCSFAADMHLVPLIQYLPAVTLSF